MLLSNAVRHSKLLQYFYSVLHLRPLSKLIWLIMVNVRGIKTHPEDHQNRVCMRYKLDEKKGTSSPIVTYNRWEIENLKS